MRLALLALLAACSSRSGGPATPDDAAIAAHDAAISTPDASTCGTRAGMRGKTARTVMAGGLARTYLVYLPTGVDPKTPIPLVIVAHGYTMSGQAMFDVTAYPALADREHVALAFPDGQGGPDSTLPPWNVGANVCPTGAGAPPIATGDDGALIDAIEADVARDQCLDRAHQYVTGFSMGGYLAHHVGCTRADIRAVAPHSGGTHDLAACPEPRKPIIIFHGAADAVVPPGCDDPSALAIPGTTPSADAWALHNGCALSRVTRAIDHGSCDDYLGCPADGQVTVCRFDQMPHCWAGGPASAGVFACPTYAKATELAWAFFKAHAW